MKANGASPEAAMQAHGVRTRAIRATVPDHLRKPRAKRKLPLLTLAACAMAPRRGYIVKGLIAPGDLVVLFGPPGAGKSVFAPYLAHAIAAGRRIFGRRVRTGPVLYIAAEDGAGMKMRATALRAVHGDTGSLWIVAEQIDLQGDGSTDPDDLAAIEAAADSIGAVLIVIDTLARAFPGLDENDGRSMGRAVKVLRTLCTDARAVMVVHHGAKAGSSNGTGGKTPRGHSVLNGDADVTLRIEPPDEAGAPCRVFMEKNRNGSAVGTMAFAIRGEVLGKDEDGDPITAPVAEETDAPSVCKLTPRQRKALDFLDDVAATEGQELPPAWCMPPDIRAVTRERWEAECEARHLVQSSDPKNRRDVFNRIAADLRDKAGAVAMRDGLVWRA